MGLYWQTKPAVQTIQKQKVAPKTRVLQRRCGARLSKTTASFPFTLRRVPLIPTVPQITSSHVLRELMLTPHTTTITYFVTTNFFLISWYKAYGHVNKRHVWKANNKQRVPQKQKAEMRRRTSYEVVMIVSVLQHFDSTYQICRAKTDKLSQQHTFAL